MRLLLILLLLLRLLATRAQFDFDFDFDPPTCNCEDSSCECCLDILFQEGCLRVRLRNSRLRISLLWNGDDLGGFSTSLNLPQLPNSGVTLQIPCVSNPTVSLRLKSSRLTSSGRRVCLNVLGRVIRRRVFNQDFCFDINGQAITNVFTG